MKNTQYTYRHTQCGYLRGNFSKLFFFYIFACVFGHFTLFNREISYNILKEHT